MSLPDPFTTLAVPNRHDAIVDKSEFLAFAERADTPEEALGQLAHLKERFSEASHHCWAYKIGTMYRFQDDGEPGGTAGVPILKAIEGQGLDHVMVVVVRFFGGTKLGTGGLVRAYGGTAAECLRTAEQSLIRPRQKAQVWVPFDGLNGLYHLLSQYDNVRGEEVYDQDGLQLAIELYPEEVAAFEQSLLDMTRGSGRLEIIEEVKVE